MSTCGYKNCTTHEPKNPIQYILDMPGDLIIIAKNKQTIVKLFHVPTRKVIFKIGKLELALVDRRKHPDTAHLLKEHQAANNGKAQEIQ